MLTLLRHPQEPPTHARIPAVSHGSDMLISPGANPRENRKSVLLGISSTKTRGREARTARFGRLDDTGIIVFSEILPESGGCQCAHSVNGGAVLHVVSAPTG